MFGIRHRVRQQTVETVQYNQITPHSSPKTSTSLIEGTFNQHNVIELDVSNTQENVSNVEETSDKNIEIENVFNEFIALTMTDDVETLSDFFAENKNILLGNNKQGKSLAHIAVQGDDFRINRRILMVLGFFCPGLLLESKDANGKTPIEIVKFRFELLKESHYEKQRHIGDNLNASAELLNTKKLYEYLCAVDNKYNDL